MERPSRDQVNMEIAFTMSGRSTCMRKQVGVVIVKDNRIIATGYNGVASGRPHCTECEGPGCSNSMHAEAGVISFCAKHGIALKDSTMYVTMNPCEACANLIINSGIKEVVFLEQYRYSIGIQLLESSGIKVRRPEQCK